MRKALSAFLTFILLLCLMPEPVLGATTQSAKKTGLVALTFDDGPGPYAARLLDTLAEKHVRVSFFTLGRQVEKYPAAVKRAYLEGHQLASHTYGHANLKTLDADGVKAQLQRSFDALNKACGLPFDTKYLVRPPYGSMNQETRDVMSCAAILWSVDTDDWKLKDAAADLASVTSPGIKDGDIILMHDIYKETVDAVPQIIDYLQGQGFEFVTVGELFRRKGKTLKAGEYYRCARGQTLTDSEEYISRGELASEMYKLAGSPRPTHAKPPRGFSDVSGAEYKEVMWAAGSRLIKGYPDGSFRPNNAVTREELAVVYCRFARYKGRKTEGLVPLKNYQDGALVSDFAADQMSHLAAAGLLAADSRGLLNPQGFIGRASASEILQNITR